MKKLKIILIILFIFGLLVNTYSVLGHPASNVDLDYDYDNQKLTVTISHNSNDIETHYIEKVEVYKNEVNIIDEDYTSQPADSTFTLTFDVIAEEGDILKVETECSLSGKTEDSITVKSSDNNNNGQPSGNNDTSTPGFGLLIAILGITLLLLIKRVKKEK